MQVTQLEEQVTRMRTLIEEAEAEINALQSRLDVSVLYQCVCRTSTCIQDRTALMHGRTIASCISLCTQRVLSTIASVKTHFAYACIVCVYIIG